MTLPAPVPAIPDTPEVLTAQQMRSDYLQQVAAIRAGSRDDITKAQHVVAAWQALNEALAVGLQDVLDRRRARVTWLEAQVPWGPDVPDSATDADRAVLLQAFRTVLAEARAATDDELHRLLTDAVAFGDDTGLRAGLTALVERDGGREKARTWWLQVTGTTELLDEAARLADDYVLWKMRVQQLFAPEAAPDEVEALRAAQQAAAHSAAARQGSRPMSRSFI